MDTSSAETILRALQINAAIGVVVALPFALFVAPRLDTGAKGSSIAFRALIVPGAVLIWPLVIASRSSGGGRARDRQHGSAGRESRDRRSVDRRRSH